MRALLDTNVLLLGLELPERFTAFKVSSLTWAEIRRGAGLRRGDGDHAGARTFETQYNTLRAAFGPGLPFDDACSAAFQTLVETTHAAGRDSKGRLLDLMIAATAVVHDAALLTHNGADFRGLDEQLTVVEV